MDHTLPCPSCGGKVRVPGELLGKKVRCPRCQDTFRAEEPGVVVDDVEVVDDGPARPRRRPVPPPAEDDDDRPRRRRPAPPPEEEDDDRPRRRPHEDDDEEEFEDDYDDRPRPRRGSRTRAAEAVRPPAIALIVVGILGLLYAVVNALFALLGGGNPFLNNRMGMGGGAQGVFSVAYLVGVALPFLWGIVVTFGGFKLMRLENFASVMVAVIFAMFPCNAACLLGLPFGIWAIVVMNQANVKRAFRA